MNKIFSLKTFSALVLSLFLLIASVRAQRSIEELASQPDAELFSKAFFGSEELKRLTNQDVKPLKKVGLLTLIIKDYASKKGLKTAAYGYKPDGEANYFATKILERAKEDLKQEVAKNNVEILLEEDYLTTEEARSAYSLAYDKYIDEVRGDDFMYQLFKNPSLPVTAKGYKPFFPVNGGREDEAIEILGDLCDELGLDALLTISIQTQTTNAGISFEEMRMTLHMKRLNPAKRELTGVHIGTYALIPRQWIPFAGLKKGELTGERYEGFGPLLGRLSSEFIRIAGTEFDILSK